MIVEIFAGTARVTAELKKIGMVSAFGTDHIRHRQAASQVVIADLTTQDGTNLLMQWLADPHIVGIFMAPPCGTASRARSIPLKRKTPGDPKPLRSDRYPNGLPWLLFTDRVKVSKANKLYFLTARLVQWATEQGCFFCVENPQFSSFWQTTFIQSIIHLMQFTTFQSCMYGSARPKRTMLGHNAAEFNVINKMCCGISATHRHQQWGVHAESQKFATALETAYPTVLARMIAAQFALALYNKGISMPPETLQDVSELHNSHLSTLRAQAGVQPKASKVPPLIPTFSAKVAISGFQHALPQLQLHAKLHTPLTVSTINAPTILPKGSKLLQIKPSQLPPSCLKRGCFVSEQHIKDEDLERIVSLCRVTDATADQRLSSDSQENCVTQVWGVPWSEEQFIEQMVKFGHPTNVSSGLPEVLQSAIEFYKVSSLHERLHYRAERLGFWLRRLSELKESEEKLKSAMDSEVAQILRNKNILLWEEMLKAVQYPDMGVVQEFRDGTDLIGDVERTHIWPTKFQPAVITVAELHNLAVRDRAGLQQQFSGNIPAELTQAVWDKTLDEVKAGLLEGPLCLDDVPTHYPLSRRFGIQQNGKVRCIDDFSRSAVNSCVQTSESPKPHTIDVLAALCVHVMGIASNDTPWVGRTFDLIGAYRQCAIRPSSKQFAHIVVQRPGSKDLACFRMKALPFGAVRSVHSFLRIAHSLWYILVKEFKVLVSNYFDDYVALAPSCESLSITSCVHMYFKLLGWSFSESGEKAPPFNSLFHALGVEIDVSALHTGLVKLGNTESRRKEIIEFLDGVFSTGHMTKHDALRLRGRLQFTSGHVFGRVGRCSLSAISNHAYAQRSTRLAEDTSLAMHLHRRLLSDGRPRELKPASCKPWFIQTDASYDADGDDVDAGIGAVLFDQTGKPISYFSKRLSSELVAHLNPLGKQSAIFECEFFALFCAFLLWGGTITNAVVIFTDNNGVRDSLISCSSKNASAKKLLVATMALECEYQLTPWYARIPTDSNLADGPSRYRCQKLQSMGASECIIDTEESWQRLVALFERWGGTSGHGVSPSFQKDRSRVI